LKIGTAYTPVTLIIIEISFLAVEQQLARKKNSSMNESQRGAGRSKNQLPRACRGETPATFGADIRCLFAPYQASEILGPVPKSKRREFLTAKALTGAILSKES
jgi:hypothetical protein